MSRTIIETFQFRCDHPGCEATISNTPHVSWDQPWREANSTIEDAGWTIQGRSQQAQKHYCPGHKPETVSTPA